MKKKNKKTMNKRKKKIIIISTAIIAFFIILIIAIKLTQDNKKVDSINDANSLKSVVEFCECKFISSKDSEQDGYNMDIYLEFKYDPYQDGQSKQPYYDVTIDAITKYLSYRKIRLIDESREITIRVDTNNTSITKKYFNDVEESEYFSKLLSQYTLDNQQDFKETEFNVNSELQTLINNEWNADNINFGTKTSTFRNYDIYFENGYRVRNIGGKIFNIVFTNKFGKSVINDIKVGDSLDDIKAELGDNYIQNGSIVEYMGKDLYVCFSSDEISVYPRFTYNYTQFEKIVEQYNEDKDFNSFMNKLTNIWPDYSYYSYDTDYCIIYYPLQGVKIDNSANALNGIQIYKEYTGNLKKEHKDYYQLYYKTNDSLIIEQELSRKMDKSEIPNDSDTYLSTKYAEKSTTNEDGKKHDIAFFSIDGSNPDSELSKNIYASTTYWYDDDNFIYSIDYQGIYIYNATTRETKTIVSGTDKFEVTNFDYVNKILTYDGKDIKIEL